MKKPLLIAASLLISVAAFAQKKELKEIEKQIRKGDLTTAQAGLKSLKTAVEGTEFAPQYYFLEAQANVEMAKKNTNVIGSLQAAGQAFTKVRQLEGGKGKYTSQLKELSKEYHSLIRQEDNSDIYYTKNETLGWNTKPGYPIGTKDSLGVLKRLDLKPNKGHELNLLIRKFECNIFDKES